MGHTVIPRVLPRITRIEHLKGLYVRGRIGVETLEEYAGLMFKNGVADELFSEVSALIPPPKRADAASSVRPPR